VGPHGLFGEEKAHFYALLNEKRAVAVPFRRRFSGLLRAGLDHHFFGIVDWGSRDRDFVKASRNRTIFSLIHRQTSFLKVLTQGTLNQKSGQLWIEDSSTAGTLEILPVV
jgi:hypothetical protein